METCRSRLRAGFAFRMGLMVEARGPMAGHDLSGLLAYRARRAGRLLLTEPDAKTLAELGVRGPVDPRSLEALRVEFSDRLCHPESAHYVAPCEHVFRRRWQTRGGWRFPPQEPGGAAEVERHYARFGFRAAEVVSCAELDQVPCADHLGVMLHFAADRLGAENGPPSLAAFAHAHLGIWVEEFCLLLIGTDPGEYLRAATDAALDTVQRIRHRCTGVREAVAE